jgi:hypothetical protein
MRGYTLGLDHGVLYPKNAPAETWEGLISVTDSVETEVKVRYMDGVKIGNYQPAGEFSGSIEAFTYPDAVERGGTFDLSYRTRTAETYEIHLLYNVLLLPSEHIYQQKEADPFVWSFTSTPVATPYGKPSAHLVVSADVAYPWTLEALEEQLYGSDAYDPRMLSPTEAYDIFESNSILRVIDWGDGTFTVTGPDEAFEFPTPSSFIITWPSAQPLDEDSYTIHSL